MERLTRSETTQGPSDRFSGEVYVDAIASGHGENRFSIGLVHFMPGARTAWHSHELGQTLYVMEGEGRIQREGGELESLRPGDRVFAPAGERHWHGATEDRLMVHMAISEGETSWFDHVE
ncbi:MAG: cupin domain-containing protein [Acidimicrobiales bacterium]